MKKVIFFSTINFIFIVLVMIYLFNNKTKCITQNTSKLNIQKTQKTVNTKETEQRLKQAYQDGWNAARQRLIDNGYISKNPSLEISGIVQRVENNVIFLKINNLDPLAREKEKVIRVKVQKSTNIYKVITENVIVNSGPFSPVRNENKEDISLDDIKKDLYITVISENDIREKDEIIASEIKFFKRP